MPAFSFSEKEWDKVRPDSVKKTGVSEAMRNVLKKAPKDDKFANWADCEKAVKLVDDLIKAFSGADALVKKAKDDKKDAAGKLKAWTDEAEKGRAAMIYSGMNTAAEEKMQVLLKEVENTTKEATQSAIQILKDLKAGKEIDVDSYSKTQQNYRGTLRNAASSITKKGFVKQVKFLNDFQKTGLDPKKIEMPDVVKTIESKLDLLEKAVDAMGEAMGQAVEKQGDIKGTSPLAQEAAKLLVEYKDTYKKIKSFATKGKQIQATAKKTVTVLRSTKAVETQKMLEAVHKLHNFAQEHEDTVLKEAFRSRDSKGDLQSRYSALAKKEGFDEQLNKPFRDWRAAIFDVVRLSTVPTGAVKSDVDDCIEVLRDIGGTTASQADMLAKQIEKDRQELAGKYGAAVG